MSRNKVSVRGYKRPRVDWLNENSEEGREPLFTVPVVDALFAAEDKYEAKYAEVFGAGHGVRDLGHLAEVAYHVGHSGYRANSTWKSLARQLQKQRCVGRTELCWLRTLGLEVARAYWAYMCAQ